MSYPTVPLPGQIREEVGIPIRLDQVWYRLTPEQQRSLFRTLVIMCHSLIATPNSEHKREISDARA
jgi:hypothetical protein